jgi:hypothetical protein
MLTLPWFHPLGGSTPNLMHWTASADEDAAVRPAAAGRMDQEFLLRQLDRVFRRRVQLQTHA